MTIKLLINESRDAYFQLWADAFKDIDTVIVINEPVSSTVISEKADAEIMRGIFAHERYGGSSEVGKSKILRTRDEPNMTPWVITTVPFSGRVETERHADGTLRAKVVPDKVRLPEEEEYISFSEIFRELGRFNIANPNAPIKTVAFSPEFLGVPRKNIRGEIEAVKNAYLDYLGSSK